MVFKKKTHVGSKKGKKKMGIERRHIVSAFLYYLFSSMWKTAWNVSITLQFQIKKKHTQATVSY